MELWISGELHKDIASAFRSVYPKVERAVNKVLKRKDYGNGMVKWAFIAMIYGDLAPPGYKEVEKFHRKRKVAEFRKVIDFDAFRCADRDGRFRLLCEALLSSLKRLEMMQIVDLDIQELREDFVAVAVNNGWLDA